MEFPGIFQVILAKKVAPEELEAKEQKAIDVYLFLVDHIASRIKTEYPGFRMRIYTNVFGKTSKNESLSS